MRKCPMRRVEAVADIRVEELRGDSAIAGRLEMPADRCAGSKITGIWRAAAR